MVFTGTPYCLIDYLIENILFNRNEFTYGNTNLLLASPDSREFIKDTFKVCV
jgi:hypothetical protein